MIGGLYSISELEDLTAQKSQEIPALENAWRAFDKTWMAFDPPADTLWMRDFNALKTRYAAALQQANLAIALAESGGGAGATALRLAGLATNPFSTVVTDVATVGTSGAVSGDDIPADREYRMVLSALQKTPGVTSPGDFQDLWDRLQGAITAHASATGAVAPKIFDPPTIQPRKGGDLDLLGYQRAKAAADALDKAGKKAGSSKTLLLVGAGLALGGIAAAKIAWKTIKPF